MTFLLTFRVLHSGELIILVIYKVDWNQERSVNVTDIALLENKGKKILISTADNLEWRRRNLSKSLKNA